MKRIVLSAIVFFVSSSFAQDSLKTLKAFRTNSVLKIDGLLDEEVWKNADPASGFIQNTPDEGEEPTQVTEVKILYDDFALYVGAMMYDTSPDSILKELGNRDDDELNAEKFRFVIDPYNTRQDAYDFGVFSSGVQVDSRFSDETYNGVWQSAVKILDNGWSVEIKIPYSAIRFPNSKEQVWGLQLSRDIRRNREFDQWCLTPSNKANPQKFWGTLIGISDIKPPLRLSLTPYLSLYYISSPEYNSSGSYHYANSFSYNAGADIKYGLDERFTLDMTLLPDFGQVQSDNKVKNLSYREVTYDDFRPFFNEGTELFDKDDLFYSRRIGKTPMFYSYIQDSLRPGESIAKNPSQVKLLNATKLSGRTNSGLGIGLFNSVTNNTYAVLSDSAGNEREILSEPFTNYNAVVFDQQLRNSSNVYIINTNVSRDGKNFRNANVTSTGLFLQNKKNTWAVGGNVAISNLFYKYSPVQNITGLYYSAGIGKIGGSLQYDLKYETMSDKYDRSDLGFQSINDFSAYNLNINYNILKQVKFIFRSYNNLKIKYSYNFTTKLPTEVSANLSTFFLFRDYSGVFFGGGISPVSSFDYYEPRVAGSFFRTSQFYYLYTGFTTDYRKRFALDLNVNTGNFLAGNIHGFPLQQGYGAEIKPRIRASDKLSFYCAFNYGSDPMNPGFAAFDSVYNPVFGARELHTYVGTFTAKYIFKNDLSLTVNARHYWNTGQYLKYYYLLDNGLLAENPAYSGNNDFSYNVFNVDAVFSWQFSPGSVLSVVYKNAIEKDEQEIPNSYAADFSSTIRSPQANSVSLKLLYFLDYQYLKRKR